MLRKDFPGGWKDDARNCFTAQGRNALQQEAFEFIRKMLNWRKGNEAVGKGSLKHFSIYNGTYVYERKWGDHSVVVFMNGTDQAQTLPLAPYAEVLPQRQAKEVLTGKLMNIGQELKLNGREIILLEFNP